MRQANDFKHNYSRSLIADELGGDVIQHARGIFDEYKSRGIIQTDSFDDDVWRIDDEKTTTSLMRFPIAVVPDWIGCSPAEYKTYVKAYISLKFGELSAFSLQEISRELLRLTDKSYTDNVADNKVAFHICDFLQMLPNGSAERDYVIEGLSERETSERRSGVGQQRVLADFQLYLHFNDVLADFWITADESEKVFYFPLYFWWNLTAILPLRVTEFLLTPRDCLNGNTLSVRRTKLKGGNIKVSYRVTDDYDIFEYTITDALAHELREYIAATDKYEPTHIDTLFRIFPHYNHLGAIRGKRNRYYTYCNLYTCFVRFADVLNKSAQEEMVPLHLGDTRHIAMISLIIAGGSPTVCRELAGHADISISSHYYSNISTLVECATIRRLRKNSGAEAVIDGEARYTLTKPKNAQPVTGGLCTSEMFAQRNISDCLKAIGGNGEIGTCVSCVYYYPDDEGLRVRFIDTIAAKSAVDADSLYLMKMVDLVRKGLGYEEDIGAALLKLQHSAHHYSMCIRERMDYGET